MKDYFECPYLNSKPTGWAFSPYKYTYNFIQAFEIYYL